MRKITFILLFSVLAIGAKAQRFEVGGMLGFSNYFGDLNPNTSFEILGPSFGVFVRQNVNTRFSLKYGINYAQISGDDSKSEKPFQLERNLSFKSNLLEMGAHLEFNFFELDVRENDKRFSPYLLAGFNMFFYNPKALYRGEWYELRPLGTEGQTATEYTDREQYNLFNFSFAYGGGFKFRLNRNWQIGIEMANRRAFTDYLDDVSQTYVAPISLPGGDDGIAAALSDRSGEVGLPIGAPGRQRGTSPKPDNYLFATFSISYIFRTDNCPWPGRF